MKNIGALVFVLGTILGVAGCTTSESDPFGILGSSNLLKAMPDTCGTIATNPMGCAKSRNKIAFVNTAKSNVTMDFCVQSVIYNYGERNTGADYMGLDRYIFPSPIYVTEKQYGETYTVQVPQSYFYVTYFSDLCGKGYSLRVDNKYGSHIYTADSGFSFKKSHVLNKRAQMVTINLDLTNIYEAAENAKNKDDLSELLKEVTGTFNFE